MCVRVRFFVYYITGQELTIESEHLVRKPHGPWHNLQSPASHIKQWETKTFTERHSEVDYFTLFSRLNKFEVKFMCFWLKSNCSNLIGYGSILALSIDVVYVFSISKCCDRTNPVLLRIGQVLLSFQTDY